MPIKFRWPQDINAIRFGATLVWGVVNGIITTIQGASPLSLVNAVAGRIKSLVQYGKCTTVDDEIYCNNGKLVVVDDELSSGYKRLLGITFDGNIRYETGEALTGDDDVTMTLDNLSTSGKNIFGSYNGANGKNFSLYIYGSASSGSYFRYGDQLKRPKYGIGKRTITFGKSGTSGFADDSDVTPDEFTTPANVYIGMLPNSSSAAYIGDIIGSIIVSNRLEWIPCERESDGVIGYYEKYNGNFLEPVGSGLPVSLGYDTSHLTALSVDGTAEVLTVGEQTATVENLLAVDDIKDEQNIISGAVTRRCEAVISDGTTPSGRYIGTVGEGNIVVKVRETGYEGDVATFEADREKPLNGLTVNVEPIQDLHGYDSPWPAGGGKNKFNPAEAQNNKWINSTTGEIESVSGFWITGFIPVKSGDVIRSALKGSARNAWYNADKSQATYFAFNGEGSATAPSDGFVVLAASSSTVAYGSDFIVTINDADLTFSPYSNICPISGRTSATIYRSGADTSNPTTYTIALGDTVYGGTLDVTGGVLTVDRAMVDLGTLNWGYSSDSAEFYTNGIAGTSINWHNWADTPPLLCSRYKPISNALMSSTDFCVGYAYNSTQLRIKDSHYTVAADFKAAMSGVQLVYELATPFEITLTPTQIDTLIGTNNIWSDAGAVKAYVADGELVEHVTPQPMSTAEGSNTIAVTSAVDPVQLEIDYYKDE